MNKPNNCSSRGDKIIRLPITELEYTQFKDCKETAKEKIDALYCFYPELFPRCFSEGYTFNGYTPPSVKQGLCYRRIKLKRDGWEVFTIMPAFVMPYQTARVKDVENALFLLHLNTPLWAITHIYGRNDMFWYRLHLAFGRFSIVGTTIKSPEDLPEDLLADEKHTKLMKVKHFIAMVVANECILGAELTDSASEAALTDAYSVYAEEARSIAPAYAPKTINTDGWAATQNAWKKCFPNIVVILCFLHAFIKIRDRATKVLSESFNTASDMVWEIYRAESKASFSQRIRRLKEWAEIHVPTSPMKQHILDLCKKRDRFTVAYNHNNAHRTSNMIDRLMRTFDRACFNSMYFHGTIRSGNQRVRAWALLWNFCPSCPATVKKHGGKMCPAERLNGKRYDDSWLTNLLVSASMNGTSGHQQNPL